MSERCAELDCAQAEGLIVFAPGVTLQKISVNIIDDEEEENDEHFFVELSCPKHCRLGATTTCEVTIQDDDGPGELHFDSNEIDVFERAQRVTLSVLRTHGCEGTIACQWATRDGTSVAGQGYVGASGKLVFEDGIVSKTIEVELIDTGAYHRSDDFQVVLTSAAGQRGEKATRFVTDGVKRASRPSISSFVHVHSDSERVARVDELVQLLDFSSPQPKAGHEQGDGSYLGQFQEAVQLPSEVGPGSMAMWLLSLPWKLICAIVPPPEWSDGWSCFLVTLVLIGLLTALVGDLASHMGCCLGISKSTTALTFVAMGTSLPDTFASRIAAATEPTADACIVNITGSNSVNVFLGLGLPWMAAAIYWASYGQEHEAVWRDRYSSEPWYTPQMAVSFVVPAGDLAYSVQIFLAVASLCFGTLIARRRLLGAELGGPPVSRWLSAIFFVGLWGMYITLSITH